MGSLDMRTLARDPSHPDLSRFNFGVKFVLEPRVRPGVDGGEFYSSLMKELSDNVPYLFYYVHLTNHDRNWK